MATTPLNDIDAGAERLGQMEKDTLSAKDARQLIKTDLAALAKITDPEIRFHAAASMAASGEQQATYKAALRKQDPAVADEVDAAKVESDRRSAEKEERKRFEAEVQQRAHAAKETRERIAAEAIRAAQAVAQEAGQDAAQEARERDAARRDLEPVPPAANSVDLQRTGREMKRDEIIMPRRIAQTYSEVDGKFFAKDSNRLMFEDKGTKMATSGSSKELVADMVAWAKAKQWEGIKLTGDQEFRRNGWLEAESQGIRTQGYTPKDADLAALKALTQERATNAITPLQERKPREQTQDRAQRDTAIVAPRHDLNKNQASMHAEASKNVATNLQALGKQPGMADRSAEELTKLAYWRGMVQEETKHQPESVQEESLARFDKQAQDPQFVKRITEETRGTIDDKTVDRAQKQQKLDTPEHSL